MDFFKTKEEEKAAKAWLHDTLLAAGIKTENKRKTPLTFTPEFIEHAKILHEELVNRNCSNVDSSILHLSEYTYNASLVEGETILAKPKPQEIAKYIVYLAHECDIYWDFRDKDLVTRMDFGETLLGHQVYIRKQYCCFRDLQSGIVHPTQSKIYRIEGVSHSMRYVSLAQITPTSPHSSENGTNIVTVTGKSASDSKCTCYFFEKAEADAFLAALLKSGKVKPQIENLRVVEQGYTDSNGYFIFGTEFGNCTVAKQELRDLWKYKVDCYKNGNPFNRMTDEQWERFVDALHRE